MHGMNRRAFLVFGTAALLGAVGLAYWLLGGNGKQPDYKFAKVENGPLTATVSAAGTLNPVSAVQISSQISGQIKEILVDFNTAVKKSQLIARIDPETYQHRLHQAEADLDATRANVGIQRAQAYQAQVNLAEAQRDFERKRTLVEKNFLSPAERDKAQTTLDAARAQVQLTEAQVKNSESVVRTRKTPRSAVMMRVSATK